MHYTSLHASKHTHSSILSHNQEHTSDMPAIEITATAPNTATKAKPYVCTTCTRPFARLEHLKRHERSHTKEKPFCCDQAGDLPGCGRRFARRDLLLRHQQKIHLFPNTSKRRRLSNVSNAATSVSSRKSSSPVSDIRGQYTISMPNLDDLKNYSNGTVNPSSIFGSSPPQSSHSSNSPQFLESQLPQNMSEVDFMWATERLLPLDLLPGQGDATYPQQQQQQQQQMWPLPELAISSSPSSVSNASWSPQYQSQTYSSIGQQDSLELAGTDSELFSPDFFIGNGAYQQRASNSMVMQQIQSQFLQSQQIDQFPAKPGMMHMNDQSYVTDASLRMQYVQDMNYCNTFRPDQLVYGSYVETY